ncbi:STAS domain-containing protein [Actinoplanes ianthinogenes]|uniref:STAS domain-containing protein n=1 Tax=Actinoplanes ianthinogenes TaxID=122358 RepID=UPI001BB3D4BF|nr:STAS domain-containing protein [Actinoplanes ianthinogenes]
MDKAGPIITQEQLPSGALLVTVTGDLDMDTAPIFDHGLHVILDGHQDGRVLLDLTAAVFWGFSALRVLWRIEREVADKQYRVRIVGAGRSLSLLLELCQVRTLLHYDPPPSTE